MGSDPGAPVEKALFARLLTLPPKARELAIAAFVAREEFVDVVQKLGLNGTLLAAEVTALRKLVNAEAASPPAADNPAYVRIPFLVSGHLLPEDAQRVREYLTQSETCRAAYRDLDGLERRLARLGPAAGEWHPKPEEWLSLADGAPIPSARRDSLAEHLRLCVGCEAVLARLAATAPRGAARTLLDRLDAPAARKKLALASVALAFLLPWGAYELTRGTKLVFEFGGSGAIAGGAPLREDPSRAPIEIPPSDAPPLEFRVPLEAGVVFDLSLESAAGAELASFGGVPARDIGAGEGTITLALRGARLAPGSYRLHLLRRFREFGGAAQDLVYPVIVR